MIGQEEVLFDDAEETGFCHILTEKLDPVAATLTVSFIPALQPRRKSSREEMLSAPADTEQETAAPGDEDAQ